jgi:hypothetical protein
MQKPLSFFPQNKPLSLPYLTLVRNSFFSKCTIQKRVFEAKMTIIGKLFTGNQLVEKTVFGILHLSLTMVDQVSKDMRF